MTVDDPAGHLLAGRIGEYLHVSGEHDEFCPRLLDDVHQLGLGLRLVFLRDFAVVERNIVVHDHLLIGHVVGDDADDIDRQRTDLPTAEEIVQTVSEVRNHQQTLHAMRTVMHIP